MRGFFPGLVIIVIAVLILLNNFGVFHVDWNLVWRLWPLLLIIAGLSLLVTNRKSLWIGVGALVVLIFLGLLVVNKDGWENLKQGVTQSEVSHQFVEEYQDTSARTKFVLSAGAGTYTLNEPTNKLATINTTATQGTFALAREDVDGVTTLTLTQSSNSGSGFFFHKVNNSADISLNSNPLWEMEFNTGAATLNADLTSYKVDRFTVKAGAASVTMRLGSKLPEMHGTISTGASSVKLQIPQSVGCEIQASSGLSSHDFNGFIKDGSTYRTEGFSDNITKIYLTIDTGVSSVKVDRY